MPAAGPQGWRLRAGSAPLRPCRPQPGLRRACPASEPAPRPSLPRGSRAGLRRAAGRGKGGWRGAAVGREPLRTASAAAAQVLPQPVAMGTARSGGGSPAGHGHRGLGTGPPSASGSEERVCVCVSRRYFTVTIGTGGGRRWRHSRTLSPLPRALNASLGSQSINGAAAEPAPSRGREEGDGAAALPSPRPPPRPAGQPPHPAGAAARAASHEAAPDPGSGPRGAAPDRWGLRSHRRSAPAASPPSPARCVRGEAARSTGRHPRGTPVGCEEGEHTTTTPPPRARPARRLFTAPYGCRGRGEGNVCRLPNRRAHYVRWSHGHRAARRHPPRRLPAPQPQRRRLGTGMLSHTAFHRLGPPSHRDVWDSPVSRGGGMQKRRLLHGIVGAPGNKTTAAGKETSRPFPCLCLSVKIHIYPVSNDGRRGYSSVLNHNTEMLEA